ncbi:hypothetical protein ABZ793_33010 [Micromonospora sp. NPDC047465]|uniref:phage terminase small subunit n=1 Tax=Micromonospora sp. NPDC047465 TaxID=3154813 RepID=UPI0033F09C7F
MGVAGRKPKDDRSQVRHRNPATHDWHEVENTPYSGDVPSLPTRMVRVKDEDGAWQTKRGTWPAATRRWWATISVMPHCRLWTPSDWQFALDSAEEHARWTEGTGAASEVRIREKLLGVTLDSRRDLRIRYVEPKTAPAAAGEGAGGVVKLDDYRDMYGG